MQRYLNLSPTKYKFKIFFYSVPILTCQQQATNIITVLFISQGSKFQSSMNTTQSLKISTLHLLLPPSFPFSSSSVYFPFPKQFPHCNFQFAIRTIFFFFPSMYVCNNTSRVKAGTPLFHFLNYFFHFLSLSQFTLQYRSKFIFQPKLTGIAGMTQNCPELDSRWNRWYQHFELHLGMRYSDCSSQNGTDLIHYFQLPNRKNYRNTIQNIKKKEKKERVINFLESY